MTAQELFTYVIVPLATVATSLILGLLTARATAKKNSSDMISRFIDQQQKRIEQLNADLIRTEKEKRDTESRLRDIENELERYRTRLGEEANANRVLKARVDALERERTEWRKERVALVARISQLEKALENKGD